MSKIINKMFNFEKGKYMFKTDFCVFYTTVFGCCFIYLFIVGFAAPSGFFNRSEWLKNAETWSYRTTTKSVCSKCFKAKSAGLTDLSLVENCLNSSCFFTSISQCKHVNYNLLINKFDMCYIIYIYHLKRTLLQWMEWTNPD